MVRRTWFRVASFRFSRKPIQHLSFDFPLDGFQISYHVGIFFQGAGYQGPRWPRDTGQKRGWSCLRMEVEAASGDILNSATLLKSLFVLGAKAFGVRVRYRGCTHRGPPQNAITITAITIT